MHTRGSLLKLPSPTAAVMIPPLPAATSRHALSAPAPRQARRGGEPRQRGESSCAREVVFAQVVSWGAGYRPQTTQRREEFVPIAGSRARPTVRVPVTRAGRTAGGGLLCSELGDGRGAVNFTRARVRRRESAYYPRRKPSDPRGSMTTTERPRAATGHSSRSRVLSPGWTGREPRSIILRCRNPPRAVSALPGTRQARRCATRLRRRCPYGVVRAASSDSPLSTMGSTLLGRVRGFGPINHASKRHSCCLEAAG